MSQGIQQCPASDMKCPNCDMGKCQKLDSTHTEVKHVCDDINHQLNGNGSYAWLEPYLCTSSDGPAEWKVRIVDPKNQEICRHLRHDRLDWHTLRILLEARLTEGRAQFDAGQVDAVNRLRNHHLELLKK